MVKHIPNILSIFRVVDLVIVILLLEYNLNIWACAFFVLGVLSDILDGHIARKTNTVTTMGKIIDPLADKILIIGVLIAMISTIQIPYWMVIVIIAREFAVTGLRVIAASENVIIAANRWGKFKTTSQFIAVVVLMLNYKTIGVYLLLAAVVFTLISGYTYFHNYFKEVK
jgi:CDP-diacylglycerol--glycerol-3-phosphate 3-phosphatidyltransferase